MNQESLDNVISKIEHFSRTNKNVVLKSRFIRFIRFDKKVLIQFAKTNCASIKISYSTNSIRVQIKGNMLLLMDTETEMKRILRRKYVMMFIKQDNNNVVMDLYFMCAKWIHIF